MSRCISRVEKVAQKLYKGYPKVIQKLDENRRGAGPLHAAGHMEENMAENKKRVYYIGGKSYSPDDARRLCTAHRIMDTVTLYTTAKGAFFAVAESQVDGETVKLMDEAEARAFMDENAAGIDIDGYNTVFGEPEKG